MCKLFLDILISFGRVGVPILELTVSGRDLTPPTILLAKSTSSWCTIYLVYSCIAPKVALYMSRRRSGSAVRNRTDSNASTSVISSGPPSPTFTATTNASQVHLDAGPETIITRRDLRLSVNAYEDVCTRF